MLICFRNIGKERYELKGCGGSFCEMLIWLAATRLIKRRNKLSQKTRVFFTHQHEALMMPFLLCGVNLGDIPVLPYTFLLSI